MSPRATVLIPTTGARGPLLQHAVASVQAQTLQDFELFVIGDGAAASTDELMRGLCRQDGRLRYFPHPKQPRRAEPQRHHALQEARGEIVCYLCDRDLYLPHHLERMHGWLRQADFAHSLIFRIQPSGALTVTKQADLGHPGDRAWTVRQWEDANGVPLSFAGHRLDAYRRLPFGWRVTPSGSFTDIYMWQQLLSQPDCRAFSGAEPSVLYFPRYLRLGWSVERRRAELERWRGRLRDPETERALLRELLSQIAGAQRRLARALRRPS